MTDLLKIIKAGTKNKTTINFPGTDKKVDLHLLSNQDTLDATVEADRLFRHLGLVVEFHNVNTYENERSIQLLFRALKNPENGLPVCPDIASFRQLVTNEERSLLIDEYNALVAECNPSPETMKHNEFDALVEGIKKNPEKTLGSCSNLKMLRGLCLYLVHRLPNLPKANGPTS